MGYKRTSGTIRRFSLNGIPFTPMADANFSEKPSQYENEAIATSGVGMIKKTKIIRTLESVTLGTDALEREVLAAFADGVDTLTCSYVDAAGNTLGNVARVSDMAAAARWPWVTWTGSEYGIVWVGETGGESEARFARVTAFHSIEETCSVAASNAAVRTLTVTAPGGVTTVGMTTLPSSRVPSSVATS